MKKVHAVLFSFLMITMSMAGCLSGDTGEDGAKGIDGKGGADGANGIDGINGTNGIDGINGTNGIDGIVEFYNGTNGITIEFSNIENNLSSGWHTIAYLPSSSNQGHATFYIDVQKSGIRESVVFTATSHFGSGNSIVLHSLSSYGSLLIDKIRVMSDWIYTGAALQIHIDESHSITGNSIRWSMSNEVANSVYPHYGWKLLNNSIPDWGEYWEGNISIPIQDPNLLFPSALVDLDILCDMSRDLELLQFGVLIYPTNGCDFDILSIVLRLESQLNELSDPRHDMSYIDLSNTNLEFTYLRNANLAGSNLNNSSLRYANLNHARMENATLDSVNLTGASLYGAYLRDANLNNADLTGANLTGAFLYQTYLNNVYWSDTVCPDGTNSDNNGNTCVNNLIFN